MLPLLWELFPGHPNLLPAFWEADPRLSGSYVRKPFFSREGCNVEVVAGGKTIAKTDGPYDDGPFVYQAIAPIADFGGQHPILGSWIIAGEASGMGVREDPSVISTNTSRFVPHFF
jgi:glutathionylspermidine synthase